MSTKIQWTDYSCNLGITGCSIASAGCANCYAMNMAYRLGHGLGGESTQKRYGGIAKKAKGQAVWTNEVRVCWGDFMLDVGRLPKKKPKRVFPSMVDPFHPDVPFSHMLAVFGWWMDCPHTLQLLTKRPDRMAEFARQLETYDYHWPDNIHAGTSVENQEQADARIPHLLRVPAKVRFLSVEPLLEAVSIRGFLGEDCDECDGTGNQGGSWGCYGPCGECNGGIWGDDCKVPRSGLWVIVGGESGPRARPCNVAWIRKIVEDCKAAGVPVFVKQFGRFPVESYRVDSEMGRQLSSLEGPLSLSDPKGGNPDEWPRGDWPREFPA